MKTKTPAAGALLRLTLSMLIFGTIGLFRRWIPASSGALAFARGMLGGLFLIGYRKLRLSGEVRALPRRLLWLLVLSGAAIGINWILLFEAYNYTTVAVATLCYYMQPTILILLSPLIFREKLTGRKLLCAAAALAGMFLVSGVTEGGLAGGQLRGVVMGLGAACFYASVVILNKKLAGIDAYQKTMIQLFSAAAVMVPYLLVTADRSLLQLDGRGWILLLIVGFFHTGFAYAMYFGSMEDVPAQTVAVFSYIDPVSALFFSWLFLHETLSPAGAVGAVLILGAAMLSVRAA